ncbi:MAG: ABC transporter permease [Anaerolineaceae bacterium]|nr:ABC transporter permease [Anaerolineaceae bacterium]
MQHKKKTTIQAIFIVLAFFLLWEIGVHSLQIQPYILPAPSQVFGTLAVNATYFMQASFLTLSEALLGLLLGLICGFFLAVFLTLFPGWEDGVMTLAILVKSTPLVAIAPLLTLWLGFGTLPKILITALLTFFPVLVNMLSGFQKTDPALMDLFRAWYASPWEIFLHLRMRSAFPFLFAALKITAPLALIGAVVAEWTGASGGLGRVMWLAYANLNLPFLFAAIFILAVSGMLWYQLVLLLEKKIIFWHQNQTIS